VPHELEIRENRMHAHSRIVRTPSSMVYTNVYALYNLIVKSIIIIIIITPSHTIEVDYYLTVSHFGGLKSYLINALISAQIHI